MIPYFLRHYNDIVDKFFIFDNGSTDGSLERLAGDERVSVAHWDVQGESFVAEACRINNESWKQSRGCADWVIVVDIDEHLYHPDLRNYLGYCSQNGVTAIKPVGYDMVADVFPTEDQPLWRLVTQGVRSISFDKLSIFDPAAIQEINYHVGRHESAPRGRIAWEKKPQVRLLHYKRLGADYLVERGRILSKGIRPGDIASNWGTHYFASDDEVVAQHRAFSDLAKPVPGLGAAPDDGADFALQAERAVLRDSGLFQGAWYLANYPDVADAGMDPLEHFCVNGWRERRKPNPHFDSGWYLQTYAEAIGPDANPLLDYATIGEQAGRKPNARFDPSKYRSRHRLAEGDSPLRHYLARRAAPWSRFLMRLLRRVGYRAQGELPANFDRQLYLLANPDVAAAGLDPVLHYLNCGKPEGRPIKPVELPDSFDPQQYLEANPDLAAAGVDPAWHYRRYGKAEGRRTRPADRRWAKRAAVQTGLLRG